MVGISSKATTLFEYEVDRCPASSREIAALRRLKGTGGADLLGLDVDLQGRIAFKATQHVGIVRLAGRTIQVLPKIYRPGESGESAQITAARNLLYLLEMSGDLPVRAHELAHLVAEKGDWFEVLTHLFAQELQKEWSRGAWRTYQRVEEDSSPVLRGTWRITEQLRQPERRHVFAVAFDEFTADNELNRVLRFTVERLWGITRDGGNRRVLGELRQWMEEVACPAVLRADWPKRVTLTRQNARFGPLLKLSELFLGGKAVQLTGGREETFAFMFDMNRLFESLVTQILRRELRSIWMRRGWQFKTQESSRSLLIDGQGHRTMHLRPDVRFACTAGTMLILDTKYKRLDGVRPGESDVYQLYAYSKKYSCQDVVLLYPGGAPPRLYRDGADSPPWLRLHSVSLQGDLSKASARTAIVDSLRGILEGICS